MSWPCISRVCCLARFWNQFDKSDLSVPLTVQNYSDLSEQEVRTVTKHVPAQRVPRTSISFTPDPGGPPLALIDGIGNNVVRDSFRGRRELRSRPREDYRPPAEPFTGVTQYEQDFRPWPAPRKENLPAGMSSSSTGIMTDSPVISHPGPGHRDEGGRGLRLAEAQNAGPANTSSYRQEYRPWSGAQPARTTRRSQASPYGGAQGPPTPETSYQAAFSGEGHRVAGPPAVTPALSPPAQGACTGLAHPPTPQQNRPPDRTDLSAPAPTEEHLTRTRPSPNPSALFQGGPRVFSI